MKIALSTIPAVPGIMPATRNRALLEIQLKCFEESPENISFFVPYQPQHYRIQRCGGRPDGYDRYAADQPQYIQAYQVPYFSDRAHYNIVCPIKSHNLSPAFLMFSLSITHPGRVGTNSLILGSKKSG